METRMRFRTDRSHWADLRNWQSDEALIGIYRDNPNVLAKILATPPALPGDVWRIRWYKEGTEEGPIAGYAICCPKCKHVHDWTTAGNCNQKVKYTWKDSQGVDHEGVHCVHNGVDSCWTWTGSAEGNTLTAYASLLVTDPACGFHGWLKDGVLTDC